MTKIINILGGPGVSKSTTACGLFYKMKTAGYKVELVTEYIKGPVYEGRDMSDDQLYIFAKQHRRMHILIDKVDWIITDSPLLLSAVYAPNNYFKSFIPLVLESYYRYDNMNFLLKRIKPYNQYGRTQSEEEAKSIDRKVSKLMDDKGIEYTEIGFNAVDEIYKIISSEETIKTSNLSELIQGIECNNCGLGYQIIYNSACQHFEIYCGCSNKPFATKDFLRDALKMIKNVGKNSL